MLKKMNNSIKMSPPLVTLEDEKFVQLNFVMGGSQYLFTDAIPVPNGSIITEIGHGSIGQAICVLTPGMFVPAVQRQQASIMSL